MIRNNCFLCIVLICIFTCGLSCFAETEIIKNNSFAQLLQLADENSIEIQEAEFYYRQAVISKQTKDGIYFPSVSLGTGSFYSSKNPGCIEKDSLYASVEISQHLQAGTRMEIIGSYPINKSEFNKPELSFSISQSLLPFWIQGKSDPQRMSLLQKQEYYFYQLLLTKKNLRDTLIQNFYQAIIYKAKALCYQKLCKIEQTKKQLLMKLVQSGAASSSEILEIDNSIWNYQQSQFEYEISFQQSLQTLRDTCGCDFYLEIESAENSDGFDFVLAEAVSKIQEKLVQESDPYERSLHIKLEQLKNERVLQKQNEALQLEITVVPDFSDLSQGTLNLALDFSSFIKEKGTKRNKIYETEIMIAENSIQSYMKKKEYIKQQYEKFIHLFENQIEEAEIVCRETNEVLKDLKKQQQTGAISSFDYEINLVQYETAQLNLVVVEAYRKMYELLLINMQ